MDIKILQYVIGHSDVGVTLNVYTHASYDRATEQMEKSLDLLYHLSMNLRRFIMN